MNTKEWTVAGHKNSIRVTWPACLLSINIKMTDTYLSIVVLREEATWLQVILMMFLPIRLFTKRMQLTCQRCHRWLRPKTMASVVICRTQVSGSLTMRSRSKTSWSPVSATSTPSTRTSLEEPMLPMTIMTILWSLMRAWLISCRIRSISNWRDACTTATRGRCCRARLIEGVS